MDNLKISIPGKPEYLTMVRLAVTSMATMAGFDIETSEDIKTAVSEACKNVACHGSDRLSNKYMIECDVDKGFMEITVRDDCDGHTIEKINKPCLNCPADGDLGIFVIKSLMDEVEYGTDDAGHKFVKMGKKL